MEYAKPNSLWAFLNPSIFNDIRELDFFVDRKGIIYLPVSYVEILRNHIIGQYQRSGDPIITGYKNRGDLEFTLDFVKSMYNNKRKSSAVIKKAAFILYNIASKHPFTDGNKRTAIITCNSFMEYNGYSVGQLPYQEAHKFITDVAKGTKGERDCQRFLKKHTYRLNMLSRS